MSENGAETPIVLDLGGPRPKKKMGSACKSHGIQVPYRGGFVFRCYKQVCPWCRIAKAERERDEAREALDFTEQAPGRIQEIMRSNGLVIDDLGDAHQKLAFTVYTELCECASQCEAARAAAKE